MEKTLVILAAGMGSRFGGIKQIEPVGPSGEIISDYNIYDALSAGFTKVIFIIKKEHLDIFKSDIISKFSDKIKVEFALQNNDSIKHLIPFTREKMLGTAHALLCAKDLINDSFALINADDYYGKDAFVKAIDFIENNYEDNSHASISYSLKMVTNNKAKVKRGICYSSFGKVIKIIESEVIQRDGEFFANNLGDSIEEIISEDLNAAMNFFVFKPSILNLFDKEFNKFLENINDTNECLLSACLDKFINEKSITLYEKLANSKWLGITSRDDLEIVKREIKMLVDSGKYPNNLWR